jgi:hypothetical protein
MVAAGGFGVDNCFIFRPDPDSVHGYRAGDAFQVTLSGGLYLADGVTPTESSYRGWQHLDECPCPLCVGVPEWKVA